MQLGWPKAALGETRFMPLAANSRWREQSFAGAIGYASAHPRPNNCNCIFREHPANDSQEIEPLAFGVR